MNKRLITVAAALAAVLWIAPAFSQAPSEGENVPALLNKANAAYAAEDHAALQAALERLHELRPYNSEYAYRLVLAYALANDKSSAYDLMLRMQQQGLAYDFTQTADSANIRGTQVFDYVNDLLKLAGDATGESEPVFRLPGDVRMPSSLAWDGTRQRFLVGTVATGQVLAVTEDGQVSELFRANADNGMWAVLDILVDEQRDRLWVSSASIPAFAGFSVTEQGRSALFEFELGSLDFVKSYPVPVDGRPHVLGSMAMAPNGDVFIADRALPVVYAKKAGEEKIQPLLYTRGMVSQRGIALQPDGRIMYVADRELGILVVDLVNQRAAKLAIPETLNVGGIDDLFLWRNNLIMIQNGISPQRVMRLAMDASGTRVETVRPLAVAQPEFDFPNFGTLRGDDLFYFASGRWASEAGANADGVTVLRTGADANADLVAPEMELFLKQQAEQQKQQREKE